MPKYRVMLARFPYGGQEESECVDWLVHTAVKISRDPRFDLVLYRVNDTPITMTRNHVLHHAMKENIDILILVDSDMAPDCELGADRDARPFWESSIDFLMKQPGPVVIAAPYCGPPPIENVYVFQWADCETFSPNPNGKIEQYTREQAAVMGGIQKAAALPTGLMMIDVRALQRLKPPFTYYEWEGDGDACHACGEQKPGPQKEKSSTEDVTFSRDLALAGIELYCNWDAWAGHVKRKIVRKPRPYTADAVAAKMHEAILSRRKGGERLMDIQPKGGRFAALAARAFADADAPTDRREAVIELTPPDRDDEDEEMYEPSKPGSGFSFPVANRVTGSTSPQVPQASEFIIAPEPPRNLLEKLVAPVPALTPAEIEAIQLNLQAAPAGRIETHANQMTFQPNASPTDWQRSLDNYREHLAAIERGETPAPPELPPNPGAMTAAELLNFDPFNRVG